MNLKKATKLINNNLQPAIDFLDLNDWSIQVDLKETTEENNPVKDLGTCGSKREYRSAHIIIFFQENKTSADLLDTLYHEMGHIYLSMYSGYREVVEAYLEDNLPPLRLLQEMFRQVDERGATSVARTLFKHFHPELDSRLKS